MPSDLEDAVDALRDGCLGAAHVLTRRAARPAWIDGLEAEEIDLLAGAPLGALFWPERAGGRLGEWLIPLDPAKARALLDPPADDRGPAPLALAFLDPEAARRQPSANLLTPYAAAAALQWDAAEAAARVMARPGDRSVSYVAEQAFELWNRPFARLAPPDALGPFLDLLRPARRRRVHRRLFLRLRAAGAACPAPAPPPPRDDETLSDALIATADRSRLAELLSGGDPAWWRERWRQVLSRLGESERPGAARALFERRLAAGAFDADLLELARPSWSAWGEALRTLARFRPALARTEAEKAPAAQRTAALERIIDGEADALLFDVRLAVLKRCAGAEAAARAALWLLLEEPPRWHDEGRLLQILVALGETPVEPAFWRALFEDVDDLLRPDLRRAILARR